MSMKHCWVRNLFRKSRPTVRHVPARLGVEALGDRIMPAVSGLNLYGTRLMIEAAPSGSNVEVKRVEPSNQNGYQASYQVYSDGYELGRRFLAAEVKDILFVGSSGNDTFTNSTSLRSIAYGYGGFDRLTGGGGNDEFHGGDLTDVLNGRGGDDYLAGGAGGDHYHFNLDVSEGWDTVVEPVGGGADTLDFSASQTTGLRFASSTWLSPQAAKGLDLGRSDKQQVSWGQALTLTGEFEGVFGTAQADIITGNALPNQLYGGGGNDRLYGGAGNDVISGWTGDDWLDGGSGDDTYPFNLDVGEGWDTLAEAVGGGTDTLDFANSWYTELDWYDGLNLGRTDKQQLGWGQALTLTAATVENVIGSRGNDVVVGNDLPNVLRGLGGNDTLTGGGGADVLEGAAGSDVLAGGAGHDTYVFNADFEYQGTDTVREYPDQGTDELDFSAGRYHGVAVDLSATGWQHANRNLYLVLESNDIEMVSGTGGHDFLTGNRLPNTLKGHGGNDYLDGAGESDFLLGGDGDDRFAFGNDAGYDHVSDTSGNDTLDFSTVTASGINIDLSKSNPNAYVYQYVRPGQTLQLKGTLENVDGTQQGDRILGNEAGNWLEGRGGNDFLSGAGGNDVLWGGTENDIILGGNGGDEIYGGDGHNVITTGSHGTDGDRDNVYATDRGGIIGTGVSIVLADDFDWVDESRNVRMSQEALQTSGKTYTFGITAGASFFFGTSTTFGIAIDRNGVYTFQSSANSFGVQMGASVGVELGIYNGTISTFVRETEYGISASMGVFKNVSAGGSISMDSSGVINGGSVTASAGFGPFAFEASFTYKSTTRAWDVWGNEVS